MPYEIKKEGNQFCVVKKDGGKKFGCHSTKEKARRQLAALYANEKSADREIIFGGEVKALETGPKGSIGGYIVKYGDESTADLQGDWFTKSTDFFTDEDSQIMVLFWHGGDEVLKSRRLTKVSVKADKAGIWAEGIMQLRDEYEEQIFEMVKAGKLGWSTGSASHLVRRKGDKKSGEIEAWPIVEASLTPMPMDGRTLAVNLKSMLQEARDSGELANTSRWSTAYRDSLPDSSFALIKSGGTVDEDGRTAPRALRLFPFKDADGSLNAAFIRKALTEIPVADIDQQTETKALRLVEAAARRLGIQKDADRKSLADRLAQHMTDLQDEGHDRYEMVKAISLETLLDEPAVERVLSGEIRPTAPVLKGIARAMGLDYDMLKELNSPAIVREERGIKGLFQDELTEKDHQTWVLWNVLSCVVSKVATAGLAASLSGQKYDFEKFVKEACGEYGALLETELLRQVACFIDEGNIHEHFYLKALSDPREGDFVSARNINADDHAALAVSAIKSVTDRVRTNIENRSRRDATKAGRKMSRSAYNKFKAHFEDMATHVKKGNDMLDEYAPPKDETSKGLEAEALRNEFLINQAALDSIEL